MGENAKFKIGETYFECNTIEDYLQYQNKIVKTHWHDLNKPIY